MLITLFLDKKLRNDKLQIYIYIYIYIQILKFSCLTQSSLKLTSINLGLPHDTNLQENILRKLNWGEERIAYKNVIYNL